MISIRKYADLHKVEIIGKLTRQPNDRRDPDGTPYRLYTDNAGNEYTINRNGVCIVTADGNVI